MKITLNVIVTLDVNNSFYPVFSVCWCAKQC